MNAILYPETNPYKKGFLDVGDGHKIYYEEVGVPTGIPVIYLHGGPGGGCSEKNRRYFDPLKYRVILFDQRGCGRSQCTNPLKANTTQHLVADMELLRKKLGVERWMVFGASWGSTLGLVYAQTHPARVSGLILRSIFLGTAEEVAWLYEKNGASLFFPEEYDTFIRPLDSEERKSVQQAYSEHFKNPTKLKKTAATFMGWMGTIYCMEATRLAEEQAAAEAKGTPPTQQSAAEAEADLKALQTGAQIEAHYTSNNFFLSTNQILGNMDALRGLPATLIHGRYDLMCPIASAYQLNKAWPSSKLVVVPKAGHSSLELLEPVMQALATYKPRKDY